jgi:hypothetical protein
LPREPRHAPATAPEALIFHQILIDPSGMQPVVEFSSDHSQKRHTVASDAASGQAMRSDFVDSDASGPVVRLGCPFFDRRGFRNNSPLSGLPHGVYGG